MNVVCSVVEKTLSSQAIQFFRDYFAQALEQWRRDRGDFRSVFLAHSDLDVPNVIVAIQDQLQGAQ